MDETQLTQGEVNDLPDEERHAGWDADEEYGGSGERASGPATVIVQASPG